MFNPNEHLMDLNGKQYLQVMWRLVWFRDEKPNWAIDTKLEQLTDNHAVFSAKVFDENGILKSAGYGSESVKDFRDFIEKAETKAVGRALAMLGYGTQFAPEMDEGERIVDSPVKAPEKPAIQVIVCAECGQPIEPKKHDGTIYTADDIAANADKSFGRKMCWGCMKEAKKKRDALAARVADEFPAGGEGA